MYFHVCGRWIFEYVLCIPKYVPKFYTYNRYKCNDCMLMDKVAYKSKLLDIKFKISLQGKGNFAELCCCIWVSSVLHWSQVLLQVGWMNGTDLFLFSAQLPITLAGWIASTITIKKTDVGIMGKMFFLRQML